MTAPAAPTAQVRSHCPYCALQCGMVASGHAGDPAVAGDADFPVTRGQMCIKGFSSGDLARRADRILQPLRKDDSGRFVPLSWPQALDEIAARLGALGARHGRDAVAVFGSGALTNEKAYWLGKFARVALGTRQIDYNGRFCMSSAAAAQRLAFGLDRGLPFPLADIGETALLVLWGSNAFDTLPPIAQWVQKQKQGGGTQVVVDPRRTATAHAADRHLQPVPGGDLALANGLLFVLLEENLVDRAFIESRTTGFEQARRTALSYYPERVERLTGVPDADLRWLARALARAPTAMVLTGRGPEQQSKGVDSVLAIINVMLAVGKAGRPLCGYGCLTGQGNGQGGREHGQKADQLPGYRNIEDDADRQAVARVWDIEEATMPGKGQSAVEFLSAIGEPGGPRALLVFGSNLAVAVPDADRVRARLGALDLLVVCDCFHSDTTALADFVLPVAQWLEEDGTITNLEGRVLKRRRLSPPPASVRTDLEIIAALAERLGHGSRFRVPEPERVFDELRLATRGAPADYSGIRYQDLDRHQGVYWPCPDEPAIDAPLAGTPRVFLDRFLHRDGRARFHAVEHRPAGDEPDDDYPLYLTTGRYKEQYNSGVQTGGVARLREARPEPRLEMHPRLAERLHIPEGGHARVDSRRGSGVFRVTLTPDIREDTVFLPFHYGGRASANRLVTATLDPRSRMPEYKLSAVRVLAAKPEDLVS